MALNGPVEETISLRKFSNDSNLRLLVIEGANVLLDEEKLIRLRDLLLREYPPTVDALSEMTSSLGIPPGYELIETSKPEGRSGRSDSSRYEYYRDADGADGNQAFRVVSASGQRSPFHRLGRIDDPESRIGKFWEHFPDGAMRKKDLVDMFALDHQSVKAMVDILVCHQRLLKVLSAKTKSGDPIWAYKKVAGV